MSKADNVEKTNGCKMTITVAQGWLRGIRKSVVLKGGYLATQGIFWQCLGGILGCRKVKVLLVPCGKRSRMPLNILKCTGQPP